MKNCFHQLLIFLCILLGSGHSVKAEDTLDIINWNVLYGFNHSKSVDDSLKWLKEKNPDVVGFQELNGISEEKLRSHSMSWGHSYAATNKESGFPVGLTSNRPIEIIEKTAKGYHHGFLHVKTYDIHFFVVHFWPGKFHEMDEVLKRITPLLQSKQSVIVMGDFNGCSRHDLKFLNNVNRRDIDFTYTDKLEAAQFVDLTFKHDPAAKISCPSPVTIPRWSKDMDELLKKQYRIDFIFADPDLAKRSLSSTILINERLNTLSDHYPVVARIQLVKSD